MGIICLNWVLSGNLHDSLIPFQESLSKVSLPYLSSWVFAPQVYWENEHEVYSLVHEAHWPPTHLVLSWFPFSMGLLHDQLPHSHCDDWFASPG